MVLAHSLLVFPLFDCAEFLPLGFPRSGQLKLSQAKGVKKIPHMTPCTPNWRTHYACVREWADWFLGELSYSIAGDRGWWVKNDWKRLEDWSRGHALTSFKYRLIYCGGNQCSQLVSVKYHMRAVIAVAFSQRRHIHMCYTKCLAIYTISRIDQVSQWINAEEINFFIHPQQWNIASEATQRGDSIEIKTDKS